MCTPLFDKMYYLHKQNLPKMPSLNWIQSEKFQTLFRKQPNFSSVFPQHRLWQQSWIQSSFWPKAPATFAANKEPQSCSNILMEYLILKRDTANSGRTKRWESLRSVEKVVGQPFFPQLMPDGYTGSSAFAILPAPSSSSCSVISK